VLAEGDGWSASEVICSAGPHDRVFEEQHSHVCIAIVVAGSFQHRSSAGRQLMTPGSLLLGSAGQYFECGHEHGVGDRCISFAYEPQYFEHLAAEAGLRGDGGQFRRLRIPPVRELSWLVSRACAGVAEASGANYRTAEWEEIGFELAARVLEMASGKEPNVESLPAAEARVTRVVRLIERRPDMDHQLDSLAREARLSRYHFLRVFQQITGLTPHRYLLRARLRGAATRLVLEPTRVLEIALDAGFGDVSNFNRAFHAEFGVSPRWFRKITRRTDARALSQVPRGSTV
jgi:AraC family transcriptional regulator